MIRRLLLIAMMAVQFFAVSSLTKADNDPVPGCFPCHTAR